MTKNQFFMNLADEWASRSKCLSRKIGAILITSDGTQVGAGYNGPPRGVPHCNSRSRYGEIGMGNSVINLTTCPRKLMGLESGEGLNLCPAAHAEANAIINAAREGISTKGLIMYTHGLPCQECAKAVINAGIYKVYFDIAFPTYDARSQWLFENSDVITVGIERTRNDRRRKGL